MSVPIPKYYGPIAILDMLGFQQYVDNNPFDSVINTYARVITSASSAAEVINEELEFMVYSDTIAIRLVNQTELGFFKFVKTLSIIINNYFYQCQIPGDNPIPIRGAISIGEYSWYNGKILTQVFNREPIISPMVNFILGKAVIDAHIHESLQQWIGISMNTETVNIINKMFPQAFSKLTKEKLLLEYAIPLKDSNINGYVVNPTIRDCFTSIFDKFIEKTEIIINNESISIDIKIKYINTLKLLNSIHVKDYLIPYFNNMESEEKNNFKVIVDKTRYLKLIDKFNNLVKIY